MSDDVNSPNEFAHSIEVRNVTVQVTDVAESDADVIKRYEPAIRRFCRSRTRSPEDAEDAAQDTFMRFIRRSDQHIRNKEAWLINAAWRACADINRRWRRDDEHRSTSFPFDGRPVTDETDDVVDVRADNPESLTVEHLTITALFRQMQPREATVLAHMYLMGATSTQVASYLGVTPDHLWVIASRARRHARAILAGMERTPAR